MLFRTTVGSLICLALISAMACSGASAVLDTRGPTSTSIAKTWWLMLTLAAIVYVAVLTLLLQQLRHRTSRPSPHARWLGVTVALSAVILTSVFIASERTLSAMHHAAQDDELRISVKGWQWWWEVTYAIAGSSDTIASANEIHIPVGRRVRVDATSGDVIHSLWVPNLQGKIDLVPGRTHSLSLQADRPGVSRAPCAEYCGMQHAHMTLLVIAHAPADFERWLANERLAAVPPADSLRAAGAALFARAQCAYCHLVRGTSSLGKLGPVLTHFASRRTIAAATLDNTPEHLTAWLENPQRLKPGTRMPAVPLTPSDLTALVAFVSALR